MLHIDFVPVITTISVITFMLLSFPAITKSYLMYSPIKIVSSETKEENNIADNSMPFKIKMNNGNKLRSERKIDELVYKENVKKIPKLLQNIMNHMPRLNRTLKMLQNSKIPLNESPNPSISNYRVLKRTYDLLPDKKIDYQNNNLFQNRKIRKLKKQQPLRSISKFSMNLPLTNKDLGNQYRFNKNQKKRQEGGETNVTAVIIFQEKGQSLNEFKKTLMNFESLKKLSDHQSILQNTDDFKSGNMKDKTNKLDEDFKIGNKQILKESNEQIIKEKLETKYYQSPELPTIMQQIKKYLHSFPLLSGFFIGLDFLLILIFIIVIIRCLLRFRSNNEVIRKKSSFLEDEGSKFIKTTVKEEISPKILIIRKNAAPKDVNSDPNNILKTKNFENGIITMSSEEDQSKFIHSEDDDEVLKNLIREIGQPTESDYVEIEPTKLIKTMLHTGNSHLIDQLLTKEDWGPIMAKYLYQDKSDIKDEEKINYERIKNAMAETLGVTQKSSEIALANDLKKRIIYINDDIKLDPFKRYLIKE